MPDETTQDWRRASTDIEVVAGQVRSLEAGFREVKAEFSTLQRDVAAGFAEQQRNFSTQMRDIGNELKNQGAAFSASRQTSISSFLITSASVASVMGAFGWAILSPMTDNLKSQAVDIRAVAEQTIRKEDFRTYQSDTATWIGSIRDRQRQDEDGAVSQRQISELKSSEDRQLSDLKNSIDERYHMTLNDLETRLKRDEDIVTAMDAQLVKRPEIEASNKSLQDYMQQMSSAINGRIVALGTRDDAMQEKLDSMFPPSKIIDELWSGLRELRMQTVAPAIVPPIQSK